MATFQQLAPTISCHAWNNDRSMLALCPNSSEVWIYTGCKDSPDASNWTRRYVLSEHDLLVSAIDWHPTNNRLLTCSHDRNAFVWTHDQSSDAWKPQVVILRINRAALDARWDPKGDKFAVTSSNKQVQVCFFEPSNNWWVSKALKRAKSSVVSVSWHPSGVAVATASTDYRCRVVSAALAEVDGPPDAAPHPIFGPLPEFGGEICEFEESRAWVNDCAWSPSGEQLAFIGHDDVLHVALFHPLASQAPTVQSLKTEGLPAMKVLWLNEWSLVTVGHNMNPDIFCRGRNDDKWVFLTAADTLGGDDGATSKQQLSSFGTARALFNAKVTKGAAAAAAAPGGESLTKHQGAITCVQVYSKGAHGVTAFSTSGVDGRLVVWDLQQLPHVDLKALRLQ